MTSYGELYAPAGRQHAVPTTDMTTSDSASGAQTGAEEPINTHGGDKPKAGAAKHRRRPGTRRLWAWAVIPAVGGIAVGVAWWLLAPGGRNLLSGNPAFGTGADPASWLPRDLTLAALFLLPGCFTAVLLDGRQYQRHPVWRLLLAVIGSATGAALAWGTGVLVGHWWAGPVDTSANPSIAFSLRSWTVLLVWPGSLALSAFILSLMGAGRAQGPDAA